MGFAFREIWRQDVDDELIEKLLNAAGPIWGVLRRIKSLQQKKDIDFSVGLGHLL